MSSGKKGLVFLLLLVLAFLLFDKWQGLEGSSDRQSELRNRSFDRRTSTLEYTRHARCRMNCRQITEKNVEEIMISGEINYAKSDPSDKPCPTYAVQGYSSDGRQLRVIFAQCAAKTRVVTCYDLKKDFECFCPGDEKKRRN